MFAELAGQSKFWGKQLKFDMATYMKRLEVLASTQLTYTINNLPPADAVGLFKVAFKTTDAGPAANKGATGIIDEAGRATAQERRPAQASG